MWGEGGREKREKREEKRERGREREADQSTRSLYKFDSQDGLMLCCDPGWPILVLAVEHMIKFLRQFTLCCNARAGGHSPKQTIL